jgi:hypothetical protein
VATIQIERLPVQVISATVQPGTSLKLDLDGGFELELDAPSDIGEKATTRVRLISPNTPDDLQGLREVGPPSLERVFLAGVCAGKYHFYPRATPETRFSCDKLDAQEAAEEERPWHWTPIRFNQDGCEFFVERSKIENAGIYRTGQFLRVCKTPPKVLQGVPVRSQQISAYAQCDKRLFAAPRIISYDSSDGSGRMLGIYSKTLAELGFAPATPGSISEAFVEQLCSK